MFEAASWMAIEEDEFEGCFSPLNDFIVEEVGNDGATVGGFERPGAPIWESSALVCWGPGVGCQ